MKNIFCIILALILSIINFTCYSQSLDNIKFYVLYDVSGSTNFIDRKNHLRELLDKTLDLTENQLQKAPSFEILFFGTNTEIDDTYY